MSDPRSFASSRTRTPSASIFTMPSIALLNCSTLLKIMLPPLSDRSGQRFPCLLHLVAASDVDRRTVVEVFGLDGQDVLHAVCGHAPGLFGQEGHGLKLEDEAELPLEVLFRAG